MSSCDKFGIRGLKSTKNSLNFVIDIYSTIIFLQKVVLWIDIDTLYY